MDNLERRCVALPLTMETREAGKAYIGGYAAKYNVRSTMLGTFREQIMPGAFTRALKEQSHPVVALWNHDPNFLLGSTRSGTLTLDTDDEGMRYSVEVPDTQLGRDLSTLIARGDVWGSSFAFVIGQETWDKDEDGTAIRSVHEVEGVYDVSPVLTPAYEQATTGVAVRSYERFLQSHRPALKLPALRQNVSLESSLRRFLRTMTLLRWNESDHPRDGDGKFGSGSGGKGGKPGSAAKAHKDAHTAYHAAKKAGASKGELAKKKAALKKAQFAHGHEIANNYNKKK
jgi:HK97 family phage prohead protease